MLWYKGGRGRGRGRGEGYSGKEGEVPVSVLETNDEKFSLYLEATKLNVKSGSMYHKILPELDYTIHK